MELLVFILLAVAGIWWFFSANKKVNVNNIIEPIKDMTRKTENKNVF